MIYILYGVLCGGGVGIGYNAVVTTVTGWFQDKVGLASGIMLMGFGLGGLALGSIVNALIGSIGIFSTFAVLGIAIAVVMVLGAFIIAPPVRPQAAADKEREGENPENKLDNMADYDKENYTPAEMIRTDRFWLCLLWTVAINSAGLLVINSAANISIAFGGTAVLGLIISLFNGAGRIFAGNNFDKLGSNKAMLINLAIMISAGVILSVAAGANSLIMIVTGLILAGLAYGGTPTIAAAYTNKTFGAEHYSENFSIMNFSLMFAAIIGPTISAHLLEASQGAYNSNFYAIIGFAISSLIIWMLLLRSNRRN